jgi:hypothetical protein
MKIRMTQALAGPGVYFARGFTYDLPQTQALEILSAKLATPVAEPRAEIRERAVRRTEETR